MSDSWMLVIPLDPAFRPDAKEKERVQSVLSRLTPKAEELRIEADGDTVRFFDCGENFERVRCPACAREVSSEDWNGWMSSDYGDGPGFNLSSRKLSCCGAEATLNDLTYEMPQGFARFGVSAMNYDRAPLTDAEEDALEDAIGAPVQIIYRYI